MTPEERSDRIERQIEFIVSQQALHSEQIGHLTERMGQLGDYLLNVLIGVVERYFSNGGRNR